MRRLAAILAGVLAMTAAGPAWTHEFLDYFEYGRAELSERGYVTTRHVVQYIDGYDDPHITITAHMDTAEAVEFSDELAARRAQAMATELVRLGVDPARIQMRSCADRGLARPTPAGVREPLNRRVSVGVNTGDWSPSRVCRVV